MNDSTTHQPAADRMTAPSRAREVRVTTGSRLHFGLLDTVDPFGGVGVMIQHPRTEVVVSANSRFVCDLPARSRIQTIAEQVSQFAELDCLPPCRVDVTTRAAEHCGLGSGSQLALATAEAICCFLGVDVDNNRLATELAQRGKRSAIGVHGYFGGGFVVEGGDVAGGDALGGDVAGRLNPLVDRVALPSDWCVTIFRPAGATDTISGEQERAQFARLESAGAESRSRLHELIHQQIVPAVKRRDFQQFTESVQQYNEASGNLFATVQGGPYNGPDVTEAIQWLVAHGARGVGQSSWGPGIFAWFETRDEAEAFNRHLPPAIKLVVTTQPRNQPREIEKITDQP